MKIFLTGATGFLGRRVVEGLVEAGHAVTALVRNPDAYAATVKAGRRSDFLAQATLVRGSLEDLDSAKEALAESDAVIHLASLVGDWA
ncbi:MAG: NAD-dependent epimerase/dehydratase family protein, partial [Stackebrandtia sp.]